MTTMKVEEYPPKSLVRAGSFEGNLEGRIARFSANFYKKASQPNIQSYGLFQPGEIPCLLNVSHELREITSPEDYNTLLVITSRSIKRNQQFLEEFQHATEIDFSKIIPVTTSEILARIKVYGLLLNILLDHPDKAMNLLRQLEQRTYLS